MVQRYWPGGPPRPVERLDTIIQGATVIKNERLGDSYPDAGSATEARLLTLRFGAYVQQLLVAPESPMAAAQEGDILSLQLRRGVRNYLIDGEYGFSPTEFSVIEETAA